MRKPGRLPIYAGAGFAFEVAFSALHDLRRGRPVRLRTSPWMLTVYALLLPLYEPVHDRLRGRSLPLRATAYGLGFLAVEYASGSIFRRLLGEAPWDYTYAKRHVDGLIRPDYFFLWALAGLLCEPLHDALDPRLSFFGRVVPNAGTPRPKMHLASRAGGRAGTRR